MVSVRLHSFLLLRNVPTLLGFLCVNGLANQRSLLWMFSIFVWCTQQFFFRHIQASAGVTAALLPLPGHVYNREFWSGAEACCRVRQTTHSQFDRQVLQLLDTGRSQVYQFGGNISWF